jgi:hypothetical protein
MSAMLQLIDRLLDRALPMTPLQGREPMTWRRIPLVIVGLTGAVVLVAIGIIAFVLPARAAYVAAVPVFALLSVPLSVSFFLATGAWFSPGEIVRTQIEMLR